MKTIRNYIATTEKRDQNILTRVKNTPFEVWAKLREVYGLGFSVDTYYGKVRVIVTNKEIVDFFDNPYKIVEGKHTTEIIL